MGTPTAAQAGTLKAGTTAVAVTNEATTVLSAGTKFQITNAARRVIDPTVAVTVEIDADGPGAGGYAVAPAANYVIDYLFGTITFASSQGASATCRVSFSYVPLISASLVREASVTVAWDMAELLVLGSSYKARVPTLRDANGDLLLAEVPTTDLDPGAPTIKLVDFVTSGAPLLLELGRGTEVFRAWVKLQEGSHKFTPGSLYEHSVKWVAHAFQGNGQDEFALWGYGTP